LGLKPYGILAKNQMKKPVPKHFHFAHIVAKSFNPDFSPVRAGDGGKEAMAKQKEPSFPYPLKWPCPHCNKQCEIQFGCEEHYEVCPGCKINLKDKKYPTCYSCYQAIHGQTEK
jgi:hypothetical protein